MAQFARSEPSDVRVVAMRILLTGAHGQLAADIRAEADRRGIEVAAYSRDQLDVTDYRQVVNVVTSLRPDVIINCAAYNAVDEAERDWKKAYLVNAFGPRNLALAAERVGAVMFHFSTDYVFDGAKVEPYVVGDPPAPLNRYGMSKLLGEQLVQMVTRRFFVVRVSWVFGPTGESNFVKKLLRWAQGSNELAVVTDQISGPTYTEDLAAATFDLLSTQAYGLYHITNPEPCSRFEWAEYILKRVGWKGSLKPSLSDEFGSAAKRPKYSFLDSFPVYEMLGRELPHWKDATDRMLERLGIGEG